MGRGTHSVTCSEIVLLCKRLITRPAVKTLFQTLSGDLSGALYCFQRVIYRNLLIYFFFRFNLGFVRNSSEQFCALLFFQYIVRDILTLFF